MAKLTLSTGKEVIVEQSRDFVFDKMKKNKKSDIDIYLTRVYLSNSGERETISSVFKVSSIINIEN